MMPLVKCPVCQGAGRTLKYGEVCECTACEGTGKILSVKIKKISAPAPEPVKTPRSDGWSGLELKILEYNYGEISQISLMRMLPKKTWRSIETKAGEMGLKS